MAACWTSSCRRSKRPQNRASFSLHPTMEPYLVGYDQEGRHIDRTALGQEGRSKV